ncbi:MAG: hypothetical protein HRF51_12120 [bacterium]
MAAPLFAADFEITKVIEIGPADRVPFIQPIKWSPDGTKLSYFKDSWLMISDTLGYSLPVYEATMFPQRYEWLSDNEIVLLQLGRLKGGKATKLSIIDLKTGQEEIVIDKKEKFKEADENDSTFFDGPRVSIEGNIYYNMEKRKRTKSGIPKSKYASKNDAEILTTNHYLSWGSDGLYKVKLDRSDSVRIGPKLHPDPLFPPDQRRDGAYVMYSGTLMHVPDSVITIIDTIFKSRPVNTVVCGIIFGSFNSTIPEVLFQRSCDDGEQYSVNGVWTYNLRSGELMSLDSAAKLTECNSPCYAPDGITIGCLSDGKAYLIKRRAL